MMKSYLLLLLLLVSFAGYSQTSINNYKYVIVPEAFSFLKGKDQYQLNSLTRLHLEEAGFKAYFDNSELPTELANNKCDALHAEVVEKKSLLATKLTLILKDCKGTVIFKSKEGLSREKEYAVSYTLALQEAFKSLTEAKYAYQPLPTTQVQSVAPAPTVQSVPATNIGFAFSTTGTLYAQPIPNGYQLIDTTPKTVLRLLKTSVPDYFLADNGEFHGIVFKKDGQWIFEYYKANQLITEKLTIKF